MIDEIPHKWQPVMLVADRRIECACGALAIFIVLNQEDAPDATRSDWGYTAWCQACWAHAQEHAQEQEGDRE